MNVILIVLDTWRRDHVGCYDNSRIHTPNIDRFAERGAVFENAYLASYPTLPCRRDIATGRYEFPWRGWGGIEPDDVTLGGTVHEAGKVSYFFTDVYHHWTSNPGSGYWRPFSGFDFVRGQERDRYVTDSDIVFENRTLDYPPHNRPEQPHFRNAQYIRKEERDWFSPQLFSRAARWLQHNADQEFFLMIDSFDPHEPWDPPRHYVKLYDDSEDDVMEYPVAPYDWVDGNLTEAELKRVQAIYAGEVTMVDRWVGHFLDQVESMGLMNNTMIILASDHGTHNGDHGRTGKNWVLWNEITRIPMIVWHPEFGHGARPVQFVQPVDYFPTVVEAMGLGVPDGVNLHGQSLIPFLRDEDVPGRDAILYGQFSGTCNITDGEYVLLQGVDESNPPVYAYSSIIANRNQFDWGADVLRSKQMPARHPEKHRTRLYHMPSDPDQENDLADGDSDALARMQRLMVEKLRAIDAPSELLVRLGLQKEGLWNRIF